MLDCKRWNLSKCTNVSILLKKSLNWKMEDWFFEPSQLPDLGFIYHQNIFRYIYFPSLTWWFCGKKYPCNHKSNKKSYKCPLRLRGQSIGKIQCFLWKRFFYFFKKSPFTFLLVQLFSSKQSFKQKIKYNKDLYSL